MVDAKADFSVFYMLSKKRAFQKEVEEDCPASNLRVSIALGMILPHVSVLILNALFADGTSDDIWAMHF
jgi:hypothetical protein